MKRLVPILGLSLLLMVVHTYPVQGGEPTGKIGPRNPTMYRCVDKDDPRVIKVDRMAVEPIKEIADNDPSTLDSNCFVTTVSDFGFDTKDAALFKGYLNELEDYCKDQEGEGEDFILVPIEDTRIEGYVYEFHPDVNNPGQWFPVPSRDVHVTAKGITFDIFWGTDEDGYYYFPNGFGAGPIILSMKLPPDAHPINPNVVINSTGLEETWTVFLGFYRGDEAPPDVTQLQAPNGSFLPFTTLEDLQTLSRCGYMDLPDVAKEILPEVAPPGSAEESTIQIPNVGGTLPPDKSATIIALAVILAIALPIAGILKVRRKE
jgi:hypothetical protein